MLRGERDIDPRRDQAWHPGAVGHHPRGARRVRGLLFLSPQAGEAHRGRRPRRRMVGVSKIMTNWAWLGLPELATTHGAQIDGLIGWIHVFMLVLFVGWGGFFTYCLIRFRKSRNPVADYMGVNSQRSSYLEVGVAVVAVVLLFGFAIPLWAARCGGMAPEGGSVVGEAIAEYV